MILAVDIGNTHICLGTAEGTNVRQIARLVTDPLRTENEYAVLMRQMLAFEGIPADGFEGAIVSSVVPPQAAKQRTIERLRRRAITFVNFFIFIFLRLDLL